MAHEWIIQMHANGGYTIFDGEGNEAGRYANASVAAAHHVFALQECRKAKAALSTCLHVIEQGIEVRMEDRWPVLKTPLAEAKAAADAVLHPPMQKIPC